MRLIIHPGYSKTATTFFQNKVFPKINGLDYIGKLNPGMANKDIEDILLLDFFGQASSNYSKKVPQFARTIADYMLSSKNDTFLISIEELQDRDTNVVNKAKKYNTNTDYNLFRINLLFEAIKSLVGDLTLDFLITIREQKSFLCSNYAGSYPVFMKSMYNFNSVDTFEKFIEDGLCSPYDNWIGSLFYADEIKKYEELELGSVKVMLYEDFKYDPVAYLNELFSFLGFAVDPLEFINDPAENVSSDFSGNYFNSGGFLYKILSSIYLAFPNYFRERFFASIKGFLYKKVTDKVYVKMNDKHAAMLDDLYRENNLILSKKYGLNLRARGYST